MIETPRDRSIQDDKYNYGKLKKKNICTRFFFFRLSNTLILFDLIENEITYYYHHDHNKTPRLLLPRSESE